MDSTALGVRQDADGNGTTDVAMRHILAAQWANTGVIDGLAVTGGTTMAYKVASGTAVCSKGPSDGRVLAWWPGGTTDVVAANPASNPRTDVVYVYSNDMTQGDPDNLVHVGVAVGTASATAPAPSIPTYATPLAYMRVPSGATNTQQTTLAQPVGNAIPYGSSLGMLGMARDTTSGIGDGRRNHTALSLPVTISIPTKRTLEFSLTVSAYASGPQSRDVWTNLYLGFALDGVPIFDSGGEVRLDTYTAQTYLRSYVTEVEGGTLGHHTVQAVFMTASGPAPYYLFGSNHYTDTSLGFPGRILRVWDRGVAD